MTILEFVEKVKETFSVEGEIAIKVCHTQSQQETLTYNELKSDVSAYNHWSISSYDCNGGDIDITFFIRD